jgi:hypothetical protein
MPSVRIYNLKQYEKAIGVLTEVGGTWQGVGYKERYLLVTPAQYEALVKAKVVSANDDKKDGENGTKPKKNK